MVCIRCQMVVKAELEKLGLHYIDVKIGDSVKKGDIIGHSGQTGLAGGDHLHFSVLVHGTFVNPVEWWDSHWIQDNITSKINLIKNTE